MASEDTGTGQDRLDLSNLIKARVIIARLGETDIHRWWMASDLLTSEGAWVASRTLPLTHATARARIAMAVARHACDEHFPETNAYHLFRLSPKIEDDLDHFLTQHLQDEKLWGPLMEHVEALDSSSDVENALLRFGVIDPADIEQVNEAELGPGGKSVPLPDATSLDHAVRILAAGFVRSKPGALAVPYLKPDQIP